MRTLLVFSLAISCGVALPAWGQPVRAGEEFQVHSVTLHSQFHPAVAMDPSGNFIVTWQSPDGDSTGIFMQRFDRTGTPQGVESLVNTHTFHRQERPAVSMDASGNFTVTWTSKEQIGLSSIIGQPFDSTGASQAGEFHVTPQPGLQFSSRVSMDGSGDFVVVWVRLDGFDRSIFAQRFDSTGTPQEAEFQVHAATTLPSSYPAVSMEPSGSFVVTWRSYRTGSGFDIFARLFDPTGTPRGSEFLVNTYTTNTQHLPAVAMGPSGQFVVTWDSRGQDHPYDSSVFARRFDSAGLPQGAEFRVNTYTTNRQGDSAISVDPSGNFVVTWTSTGYRSGPFPNSGIFGQFFDSSGTPQGGEFQVNTFTILHQYSSEISMDDAGNFVVVWVSGQDYSGHGVFGQRFRAAGTTVADAGADFGAECASSGGAMVILDGSASSDLDSTPGTNDDIVAFDWFEDFGLPSETILGSGETLEVTLSLGTHVITLLVTDSFGEMATDEVTVTVVDTVSPALEIILDPIILWPPNHRMVEVVAQVTELADACGEATMELESVESNEPDDAQGTGDGSTVNDVQLRDALHFALRAERDGRGYGRTYTVIYRAEDASGNSASGTFEVTVPHDLGGSTEPLMLSLSEIASGTVVQWGEVLGALSYDLVRGDLRAIRDLNGTYHLGSLTCIAAGTTRTSTTGQEDTDQPALGEGFFYLAAYDNGLWSGYGTESAANERFVPPGLDGCH